MIADARGIGAWWALAVGLLVAAHAGLAPEVLRGLGVGLLIGGLYVWMLMRRTAATARLAVPRAVAAAQLGGAARMVAVFLGFIVCMRIWPDAGFAWAASAFFLPEIVALVRLTRGGQG